MERTKDERELAADLLVGARIETEPDGLGGSSEDGPRRRIMRELQDRINDRKELHFQIDQHFWGKVPARWPAADPGDFNRLSPGDLVTMAFYAYLDPEKHTQSEISSNDPGSLKEKDRIGDALTDAVNGTPDQTPEMHAEVLGTLLGNLYRKIPSLCFTEDDLSDDRNLAADMEKITLMQSMEACRYVAEKTGVMKEFVAAAGGEKECEKLLVMQEKLSEVKNAAESRASFILETDAAGNIRARDGAQYMDNVRHFTANGDTERMYRFAVDRATLAQFHADYPDLQTLTEDASRLVDAAEKAGKPVPVSADNVYELSGFGGIRRKKDVQVAELRKNVETMYGANEEEKKTAEAVIGAYVQSTWASATPFAAEKTDRANVQGNRVPPSALFRMDPGGRTKIRQITQMCGTTVRFTEEPSFDLADFRDRVSSAVKRPTPAQLDYAEKIFNESFAEAFDSKQKQLLSAGGADMFDAIQINGQSLNELYGKRYAKLSPQDRERRMKAQFAAAALDGSKDITYLRMTEKKDAEGYVFGEPLVVRRILDEDHPLHQPEPGFSDQVRAFFGSARETEAEELARANARMGDRNDHARIVADKAIRQKFAVACKPAAAHSDDRERTTFEEEEELERPQSTSGKKEHAAKPVSSDPLKERKPMNH